MKKKNAFTLIELLAIIVILAIIAVITVPIILNIIDNSKKGAVQDSAYGYKDAINKMYVSKLTENPDYSIPNNSYNMSQLKDMGVTVSGQEPNSNSWVIIENNNVTTGCLQFDEYKVNITEGKVGNVEKGTCTPKLAISGDGLYAAQGEPGRYIYRGANPDNYIWLDENGDGISNEPNTIKTELYRIVSFESDGTIKVVKAISIGNKAWDASEARKSDGTNNTYCPSDYGCNVWGNQNNTLYNGSSLGDNFHYIYYANATDTSMTDGTSGKVGSDSTLNTFLNSKIENSENSWQPAIQLDDIIETHSWNVGGIYDTSVDKGIEKEKEEESQLKWRGKIALLNITEFVETSTNEGCTSVRSSKNSDYPCKESNWAFRGWNEWSLSPYSSSRISVWRVYSSGNLNGYNARGDLGVRPAFYLKSSVKLGGLGTSDEPYYIES